MLRNVDDLARNGMLNGAGDGGELAALHIGNRSRHARLRHHRPLVWAAGAVVTPRTAVPAALGFLAIRVARIDQQVEPGRLRQQPHESEGNQEPQHHAQRSTPSFRSRGGP